MILGEGLRLVAWGAAIGLLAAFAASRWVESQLFGVRSTDPLTFAAVCLLLLASAVIACVIPARRAMRVDPAVALRSTQNSFGVRRSALGAQRRRVRSCFLQTCPLSRWPRKRTRVQETRSDPHSSPLCPASYIPFALDGGTIPFSRM